MLSSRNLAGTLFSIASIHSSSVKSKYFVEYVHDNLLTRKDGVATETADEHIRNLFVGPRSMAKRLTMLKVCIETMPQYARLANNGLINQLYSPEEDAPIVSNGKLVEKPSFITVLDNVDSSKVNSDLLTDGWEDLLKDDDPIVRAFAKDLIIYAFMTSGEFKGWTKLFKYVPASWIKGEIDPGYESYSSRINKILRSEYNYSQHFDEVAAKLNFDVFSVFFYNGAKQLAFLHQGFEDLRVGGYFWL